MIELNVINTGSYNPKRVDDDANTGIGFANSARRLNLLYGKGADISIVNENNTVVCKVVFPVRTKIDIENENTDY